MTRSLKLISVILLFVILSGVFFYMKINKSYAEIINLNWDIKLPNLYKELYSTDSGPSVHGDGERYHVFEYKSEEEIIKALDWIYEKNVQMETEINEILDNLEVPKENIPDYDKEYKYYTEIKEDNSKIYFLFIPETRKLYVIEEII